MNKPLLILLLIMLLIGGGIFWVWQSRSVTAPVVTEPVVVNESTKYVTDVDPDVSHWQTRETEFYTIKFPKEWYLKESDAIKTGYRSVVITNNPDFDIDKYADISLGVEGDYPLALESSSEIVITTNNLGWVTSDAGNPREFLESVIHRVTDAFPSADCSYVSNPTDVPLIAKCLYVVSNSQKVVTYYISKPEQTFSYTARMANENTLDVEPILRNIFMNIVQRKNF